MTPDPPDDVRVRDSLDGTDRIGPLLFCHGCSADGLSLAALVAHRGGGPPLLEAAGRAAEPRLLDSRIGFDLVCYRFVLPADAGGYRFDGEWMDVATDWRGDLSIAYVACNGQEHADRERRPAERNRLWRRLADRLATTRIHLLLHGGDQLYADEMLQLDPALAAWGAGRPKADHAPVPTGLETRLADYLFRRYLEVYSQPAVRRVMARVPSLAIWDDHDICDGWGSRPAGQLDAPLGRLVFQVARERYLHFQLATEATDLPAMCPDRTGATLTWGLDAPGLRLIAPDLRSERRPDSVMSARGWSIFESLMRPAAQPPARTLVLSSVPALGPRLSLVESLLGWIPHAQKYEDDLRDQWQSRAHRAEWRRFLETLLAVHEQPDHRVTVLSGEIHLATRGTLSSTAGELHQLVASGIAHPPTPRAYAHLLGGLARLGDSPVPDHRIDLRPLPGQRSIYTAQRNYLMLARRAGAWSAWWELEKDGATPSLALD